MLFQNPEGFMKSKKIIFMVVALACFGVLLLGSVCLAESVISISDVTVELIKVRPPVGGSVIREYTITAVLRNTGDTKSTNITVMFKEPQSGITGNLSFQPESYSLQPNEEKLFVFTPWPTPLNGEILLNISFKPTSPKELITTYNSGYYHYTLQIGDGKSTTSTPGFEIFLAVIAIVSLLFVKKIKNNKEK
jgi:hypothetical protein